jgi:LysR family transcriptional regulator for bpeEF and oprC
MDFKVLAIFVKVGELRSFVRAAVELRMGQSGVSNAISRLENELGVQLIARTTRSVNLTEDGAAFLQRCRQIMSDLDEARQMLGRSRSEPAGTLRVDLPSSFGRECVLPRLGAFRAKYPALGMTATLTDNHVDLVEERVDVAVRIGALRDSRLVARKLTQYRFVTVATPSYLEHFGRPAKPEDLLGHNCLAFLTSPTTARQWRFRQNRASTTIDPKGDLCINDGAAIVAAVTSGYGIAQIQDYYADSAIAAGALERVLIDFDPAPTPISIVYAQTQHLSPKIRAFVDFMKTQF